MKRKSSSNTMYQVARGLLVIIGVAMLLWLGSAQPAVAQGLTPPMTPLQSGAPLSECLGSGEARSTYHAQTGKVRFVGTAPGKPLARSVALPQSASPESAARDYLSRCGSLFGLGDQSSELTVERQKTLERGRSMVRFQQTHQGIPVVGGELIVNLDSAKNIVSVSGEILPTISVKTAPAVNAATAQRNALQAVAKKYQLSVDALTATQPKLWIYNPTLIRPGGGFTTLVWRMEVTPKNLGPIRELVLIDAQRGSVTLSINQMDTAKNRETYTANNGTTLPGTLVCNESNPTCSSGDSHAVAAHTYAGDTYDFYFNYHGRDSINNLGMTLRSTVHYRTSYCNAFWNGSQMVYGDGCGMPLADDVVAHELTHGVTQYESNLFYYYQSGAINESFSDLWGEFVDLTNGKGNDAPSVRWLMGEDVSGLGAIRNMQNPPAFSDPDKMTSTYYYTGAVDSGGVHTNSGVNNKAAYLMTDGGTFNGQTITALGITKVAKIYYEAQTNLLVSGSDYADLYDTLYQGCINLIGTSGITSSDCQQVRNATIAVEMNQQPIAGYNPDAPICASGQTPANLFFDNLESGSGNWTFGALSGTSRWGRVYGYAHSGTYSLYGDDYPEAVSDSYVAMNTSVTLPSNAYLHFAHAYGFQDPNNDGGVLEYSTNGGTSWNDAGSLFDYNGYNGTISSGTGNPLASRSAFVADSHGYISSRLNLASLASQSVRFRWRMGLDSSTFDWGWWLDDVQIYTCGTPPAGAKWTFMVYLDGDNNLESAGITDFLEMSSVGSNSDVKIVVQFDRVSGYDSQYGDWTDTRRFYITQGMEPTAANGTSIGEANMGAAQTLIDFVNWAKTNYPADHYALVLWDHGSGWRLRADMPPVKGVAYDDTSGGDALDMPELRNTLNTLTNNGAQPIDLLGYDACLMGMIEVDNQVMPYVSVRVGSEETVPNNGWPYNPILSALRTNPTMTASQLGTVIVDNYYSSYGNGETHSAVNLQTTPYGTLNTAVNSFATALINGVNSNYTAISNARGGTQAFYDPTYIDLYDFAYRINQGVSNPAINTAATNVMNAVNAALIHEHHGTNYPGAHGISIYFPQSQSSYDSRYDGSQGFLQFTANTQWDEWLHAFYNYNPGGPANDDFNSATLINSTPYTTTEDTTGATTASDDPTFVCLSGQRYKTVWFRYTPTQAVSLTVDTIGSNYDTVLAVWTGSRGNLTSVGCNDDYNGLQSRVQVSLTQGQPYQIEAASYSDTGGQLTLNVTTGTPICYSLATNVNPSGSGTVSANPAPNCGSQYTSGTVVTLTANANSGYTFGNWSGDASGSSNQTTVTMNANRSVTANFTPFTTNWVIKASMSVARSRPAVAAVNGKVYVIGGESARAGSPLKGKADDIKGENWTVKAYETAIEEYTPSTNTWSTGASKPTGVSNTGAGVINNKIYVLGGFNGTSVVSVVEVYDPATNTWSTVASLPTAQYGHAVAAVNNKLYVLGGWNGTAYTNTCYIYDPSSNSWSSCASMAYARAWAAAGVVNGKIYVVGGRDGSTADFNYVEEYNPTTNTWQTRAPMATARGGPGAVGVGNYLYGCGGGWITYLASCERYDPVANTWAAFDTMNIGRRTFGLVVANGKLYAEAGYKGTFSADNEENALTTCYTLTTNANPSGGGSVNASPAPNCGTQYTTGTVVTLTANANTGYTFSNWGGDASGASNPTLVTMDANKSVTANFARSSSTTLTSSANPSVFDASVTFTVTVTQMTSAGASRATHAVTPTGTVTFMDGATTLGTSTLDASGVATYATTVLAVGSHNITAQYGGDVNFTGSTSAVLVQIVKKVDPVVGGPIFLPMIQR